MNTVVERLIESWLDSQTERRYQPAFIQLLISEGWSVVHNTRHSPIEFGKDVIARSPDGVLHCFQLKGNPGGRVTKRDAQGLLSQVLELLETPAPGLYRAAPDERHVAVFVTNGTVDEEATLLFSEAAQRTSKDTCPASSFILVTRGELLSRFVKAAGRVWPTSVEGTRLLLNVGAEDGRSLPDPQLIGAVLAETAPPPGADASQPERNANLSALLLIGEVLKAPWYSAANHYGLHALTILVTMHALRFADNPARKAAVTGYATLAVEHCRDLLLEAQSRGFRGDIVWADTSLLGEFDIMWERRRLVADCAAVLLLSGFDLEPELRRYAGELVTASVAAPRLWGLGAVPAFIVRNWAQRRIDATLAPDLALGVTLKALVRSARAEDSAVPLYGPYFTFLDCWAVGHGVRHLGNDAIFRESAGNSLWFGKALLMMLAKRNLKQTCKEIWPGFSRLVHEEADLPTESFYDPRLTNAGGLQTETFHRKEWRDLVQESVDESGASFLDGHDELAWMIASYVSLVPYRAWTSVLMWLDHRLAPSSYGPGRIPE
jgi:hypothetical protein